MKIRQKKVKYMIKLEAMKYITFVRRKKQWNNNTYQMTLQEFSDYAFYHQTFFYLYHFLYIILFGPHFY